MPKNFGNKLGHFDLTLHQNYGSYDVAQGFYRLIKMPSFILDHFWMVWIKNWAIQAQKKRCLDSAPPHPTDRPKSPPWLELRALPVSIMWFVFISYSYLFSLQILIKITEENANDPISRISL